ncbi:ProQ/FINO family protein [Halomonas cerina]|uniref:ProP effector n=1 Tax=Halomonas cerina TaxID=447424 RepID=A0A839VA51_9GAMM|nr:ProQ/FINO family protein [Halomonas cerina]MBB3190948.1 ProP effector [Halomonas cerina]
MEEGTTRLLEALEGRAEALMGLLRDARVQQQAQRTRLEDLERRRVALETSNAELAARVHEAEAERDALASRLGEVEQRLAASDAIRLELTEENRELEAQNRELEAHNTRLLEQATNAQPASVFQPQGRRTRGLSALIGHRLRPDVAAAPDTGRPETETRPSASAAPAASEPVPPPQDTPLAEPDRVAPPSGEVPSPQALLGEWYRRYDRTFFKGHTRPLKVGIHKELAEREPWPEKLVRRALAGYVNLPRYLKSVREGAERIDLAGAPAGRVDAAAAEHARHKLERLQAARRQGKASGKPHPDKAHVGEKRTGRDGRSGKSDARRRPPATEAPREPATLEEKLNALIAKHNGR